MDKPQKAVWLIRGGSKSEAEALLLDAGLLALGPSEVGDVKRLTERDEFKEEFRRVFPDATASSIGGAAGQLFRFVREANIDDVVVYPRKKDGNLHVGLITGIYRHNTAKDRRFPHQRKVRWLCIVRRREMSPAFLKESCAFKSFYRLAKCEQEVIATIDQNVIAKTN